jgi:DNA-binding MarR family transcriptional regulator
MSSESTREGPHLGALLRVTWQSVWKQIYDGVVAAGYDDVNPAHVGLFGYPGLDQQRPSELANRLQITRQSVNDLLGHLEHHGYLTREPDLNDGRARIVELTPKGHQLQGVIHGRARTAEQLMAVTLGARRFTELRRALEDLNASSSMLSARLPSAE